MNLTWDFQLCVWGSVALMECLNLTPDAWELAGLKLPLCIFLEKTKGVKESFAVYQDLMETKL